MKALATKVKHFLDYHRVSYRVLNHERTTTLANAVRALDIDPSQVINSVLLKDKGKAENAFVLAVLPLQYQIDIQALSEQLNRDLEYVSPEESDKCFNDCESGSCTPFGEAYGISLVLDQSIEKLKVVYLEVGSQTTLIQLSMDDFQFLTTGAPHLSFAISGLEAKDPKKDNRNAILATN